MKPTITPVLAATCPDLQRDIALRQWIAAQTNFTVTPMLTVAEVLRDRPVLNTDLVLYLPPTHSLNGEMAPLLMPPHPGVMPWVSLSPLPTDTAIESAPAAIAWIASTELLPPVLPHLTQPHDWTLLNLVHRLEQAGIAFHWGTGSALPYSIAAAINPVIKQNTLCPHPTPLSQSGRLGDEGGSECTIKSYQVNISSHSVLAVVPHYRCEAWLSRCLRSLVTQTRPPDGIVVVDDGSEHPPIEIVEQFPTVTLLTAPHRVGPYRLIQQVINDTSYWGYLFQDADDWSSSDRLQGLLQAMLTTDAELVGTQEIRVYEQEERLTPVHYPLDVNAALATKPGHPLLHPTSLVTRSLVQRLGGFATGLRFGGDTEFLLRAVWCAKAINIPSYSYFRRKRPHSLTTDPETGLDSPARRALLHQLKQQAIARHQARAMHQPINLNPIATTAAVPLRHMFGPALEKADRGRKIGE